MQLLYSATIPIVEFASVSILLDEASGERMIAASPMSTTPFSCLALDELDEYLMFVHNEKNMKEKAENPVSCAEQLAVDDIRHCTTPQIYRSEQSGLALYYWMQRDSDFSHNAFSVLMGSSGSRPASEKVLGVVVCVGVSGGAYPSSPLLRTIFSRIQDAVTMMKGMSGDPEDCKNSYKALLSTFLLSEDEERRTNSMVESQQISMELEADINDEESNSRKFGIKGKRPFGMKRGASTDLMNATFVSASSADKARLLEKRSAILSVIERDCTLRKYELRNHTVADGNNAAKSRRRKNKTDEVFRDFDFTSPKQAKSILAEVAAAAARSRPPTPVAKKPSLPQPHKDTLPKKLPLRNPSGSILAPPRASATSSRRATHSAKKKTSQPQAAFNVFDTGTDGDEKLNESFIEFPGLDETNNKAMATRQEQFVDSNKSHASESVLSQSMATRSTQSSTFDPFTTDDSSSLSNSLSSAPKSRSIDDLFQNHRNGRQRSLEDDSLSLRSKGPSSQSSVNKIHVNVALNEDLTCSYKQSKISSCTIEGVIQVQVKYDNNKEVPFALLLRDTSRHIRMIQENRRYAVDSSDSLSPTNEEDVGVDFKFVITVPNADNYFPIMRYKCSPELRPVPIRIQTRVRVSQEYCRVALQISSNPANEDELSDLTIIMGVPDEVRGESLITFPPGGVWNAPKRSVIWCVAELGDGEKFQLQAQFEIPEKHHAEAEREKPKFPVLVRCQCMYAQLSDIEMEVRNVDTSVPTEVIMKLARRFRLSHRERS
jgi:Adaptor complexes medium subunit family